jgi:hypothetical protein
MRTNEPRANLEPSLTNLERQSTAKRKTKRNVNIDVDSQKRMTQNSARTHTLFGAGVLVDGRRVGTSFVHTSRSSIGSAFHFSFDTIQSISANGLLDSRCKKVRRDWLSNIARSNRHSKQMLLRDDWAGIQFNCLQALAPLFRNHALLSRLGISAEVH